MPRGYVSGPFGQVHCERNIRATGIDPPGFGNSDPPPFLPTLSDCASVMPAVMDQLSLDEANIAGHHSGALVAAEFSVQQLMGCSPFWHGHHAA